MKNITLILIIISLFLTSSSLFAQGYEFGLKEATSLGSPVNTYDFEEFAPTISADGKTLVFESDRDEGWSLYITHRMDSTWTEPELLVDVNSEAFDGGPFLSYDGNYLLVTSGRDGNIDIFLSERLGKKWTVPVSVGSPINTGGYDGFASLTADGSEMFFMRVNTSDFNCNRDFSFDIYSSVKKNGVWQAPVKLPDVINSEYCEAYPRILPDSKTLIFSSSREGGFGGLDLYKSERLDDGTWTEPVNLGDFINTEDDDALISVPASGDIMYYTSGADNYTDLFVVPIPVKMQSSTLITVGGKIYDAKTKKPLFANIKIINEDSETDSMSISSNKTDGEYIVLLDKGKKYDVSVSLEGYIFYSTSFDLTNVEIFKEYNQDIYLQPIEIGAKIVLNNIYFDVNKATLLDDSKYELARITKLLKLNSNLVVEIAGYTDAEGSSNANLELSKKRAQSVVDYLISSGIDKKRLIPKGYGESNPIADNNTEEGRKKNRRVEFVIINN